MCLSYAIKADTFSLLCGIHGPCLLTVKVSYFTALEDAKMAFNALVAASISFLLSRIASKMGLLSGSSSVSNKGTTAPDATTADTFSSFPATKNRVNAGYAHKSRLKVYLPYAMLPRMVAACIFRL